MKNKLAILLFMMIVMSASTPVYAIESQNFGTAGNVSVQQQPNDSGSSDDWIVVSPGESGRGIIIQDENGNSTVIVDRYGGVYVNGKLFVNGKAFEEDSMKAAFTPVNGFLYAMVLFSLLLNLVRFTKKQ